MLIGPNFLNILCNILSFLSFLRLSIVNRAPRAVFSSASRGGPRHAEAIASQPGPGEYLTCMTMGRGGVKFGSGSRSGTYKNVNPYS